MAVPVTNVIKSDAARKTFAMGGKQMVYDRGRYKESGNVGSVNESKGPGFLKTAGTMIKSAGQGAVMGGKQLGQIAKGTVAQVKANVNLAREKAKATVMDNDRKVTSELRARPAAAKKIVPQVKAAEIAKPKTANSIGDALKRRNEAMAEIEKQSRGK